MSRTLSLLLFSIILSFNAFSQQNTKQHRIEKGETVFSIAKKYGVNMQSIFQLNPGSREIIYAGQSLRVPSKNNSTASARGNITTYNVVRGDTKIGLSKKFGVSIASLEQQNPQIIDMLQAGHVLKIDKNFVPEKPKTRNGQRYVSKGETLWGIAKENNVSVDALIAANRDRLDGVLKAGQTLRIPEKNQNFTTNGLYIVQKGDTKWQLAKRFDTSIAQLERNNPQIVNMLMAGHRLKIDVNDSTLGALSDTKNLEEEKVEDDASEIIPEQPKSELTNDEYILYTIKPQETLFGLAKKAGVSMADLTKLNPKLKNGVIKGTKIKMPSSLEENASTITNNQPADLKDNKHSNLLANLNLNAPLELYFYLPFSQTEFDSRDLESNDIALAEKYSNEHLEFYEGATIAMDSIKSLGLNFDVAIIESGNRNTINIDRESDRNAVLVPYLKGSEYPEIKSKKPVSIISVSSNFPPDENHTVYEAMPSINKQKLKILNYINGLNANIIMVSDLEKMRNHDLITSYIPNAKFLKVDKTGFFEGNSLDEALDKNRTNYIILDTDKTIVFLNTTTTFMSKLSSVDLKLALLEKNKIPEKGKVSDIRFKILKMIYPSALPIETLNTKENFNSKFESLYKKPPSDNALIGFDITFDILLRLAQDESFEDTMTKTKSEHFGLKFDYQKTTDKAYQNKGAYILQFNSSDVITEID